MTREQAINYLISSGFSDEQVSEVVRALTYEPTPKNDIGVDLISRVDAINAVSEALKHTFVEHEDIANKIIGNLPSVTTKNNLAVDCISRQDVLSEIIRFSTEEGSSVECQQLYCDVNNMPSVTPQEPRWIPVSERLPEEDESVLLTICANSALYGFNENFVKVMCGSYSPCEDKRDWIVNGIRYYIDNVIAWMPLPQAYSEVKE